MKKTKEIMIKNNKGEVKTSIILISALIIVIVVCVIILYIKQNQNTKKNEEILYAQENIIENTAKQVSEFAEQLPNGVKVNTSEKVSENKDINGLTFSNIKLTEDGGITTLLAEVKNNTGKKTEAKMVTIEILDKEGNVLTDFEGFIDAMDIDGSAKLNASLTGDVSNAYDLRIKDA